MGEPNLELWDKAIKGLKSMSCESNAFDVTDYEALNNWLDEEFNKWANSGT